MWQCKNFSFPHYLLQDYCVQCLSLAKYCPRFLAKYRPCSLAKYYQYSLAKYCPCSPAKYRPCLAKYCPCSESWAACRKRGTRQFILQTDKHTARTRTRAVNQVSWNVCAYRWFEQGGGQSIAAFLKYCENFRDISLTVLHTGHGPPVIGDWWWWRHSACDGDKNRGEELIKQLRSSYNYHWSCHQFSVSSRILNFSFSERYPHLWASELPTFSSSWSLNQECAAPEDAQARGCSCRVPVPAQLPAAGLRRPRRGLRGAAALRGRAPRRHLRHPGAGAGGWARPPGDLAARPLPGHPGPRPLHLHRAQERPWIILTVRLGILF